MVTKIEDRNVEVTLMQIGNKPSNLRSKINIPENLQILQDGEIVPINFNCMRIMTIKDGDKRIVWDSNSLSQINEAEKMFDKLKNEGLVPYCVGTDGKATSEEMDEFDAHVEEIIFLPMKAVCGG